MIAQSINLTNSALRDMILHLQESNESYTMKSTIRTKEKCPKCNKPFVHLKRMGYGCPECLTKPSRVFIDLSYEGKRCRVFCDKQNKPLDSYQRALDIQGQIQNEIKSNEFDPENYVKADIKKRWTKDILDHFLEYKIDGIAPSYKKDYKRMVGLAKEFFGITDVRAITNENLIFYKYHLEEEHNLKGKTLKNVMDVFRAFIRCCDGNDKGQFKAFLKLKKGYTGNIHLISRLPDFPPVEVLDSGYQWLSMEDQINLFTHVPDEHKPLIGFLMLHGCRPSEARALKCKDVDIKRQTVTISSTFSGHILRNRRKGRGAKSVTIPIHRELLDYIQERVRGNLPEAFLFVNAKGRHYSETGLKRIWDAVRMKANIDKSFRLYDCTRHSFASNLLDADVPLAKIGALMGHSSIKTTEKYAHPDAKKYKTTLEKLTLKPSAVVTELSPEAFQSEK